MLEYLAVPASTPVSTCLLIWFFIWLLILMRIYYLPSSFTCPLNCQLIYLWRTSCLVSAYPPYLSSYLRTALSPVPLSIHLIYCLPAYRPVYLSVQKPTYLPAFLPMHLLPAFQPAHPLQWLLDCLLSRTHSHKAISPQRRGLKRGWKDAKQVLNPLAAFVLVYKHFPPTPCFVHRIHTKPPVIREGTLLTIVLSFLYTKVPSLMTSCS